MATKQKPTQTGRVRKLNYKSKKKAVRYTEPIPGSIAIFRRAISQLWKNKKLFGGILVVYLILYVLFVKGLATGFQLTETRTQLEEAVGSELSTLDMGSVMFGTLVGTAGTSSSDVGAVYQTILFLVFSLAIIWALRQTFEAPKEISITKTFYSSMYPLVPYVLVWLVILLQLIPAFVGSFVYSIVVANAIAVGMFEQIVWLILLFTMIGISIFLVSSSIFATYIVALPDMRPMIALKKARSLVRFRRFLIIRRLVMYAVIVALLFALIFFPLVLYAAVVAEILFIVCSLALLLITHAYIYMLYREMI